jgi:hypothetical protein
VDLATMTGKVQMALVALTSNVDKAVACGINLFFPNVELAMGMNGQLCHVSNNTLLLPNVDLAATMRRDTSKGRLGHKRRAKKVIEVDSDSDESSVYQAIP